MTRRSSPTKPKLPIRRQVSAGGVAFRRGVAGVEVALITPRGTQRWQLPKGLVDVGEGPDMTARREVREEAGIDGEVVAPIETIDYWYVGADRDGTRARFHKSVHFFLIAYRAGDVGDHDHEVADARWVVIGEAMTLLAFENERRVVEHARGMIEGRMTRGERRGDSEGNGPA
jgi:8-oxo-dGTP pyrophosphatase MutT (NUDIX family)